MEEGYENIDIIGRVSRRVPFKGQKTVNNKMAAIVAELDPEWRPTHMRGQPNLAAHINSFLTYDRKQPEIVDRSALEQAEEWTFRHWEPFIQNTQLLDPNQCVLQLNLSTGPGFPWNLRYSDKRSLLAAGAMWPEYYEKFWQSLATDDPMIPIWMVTTKREELRPLEKLAENSQRTYTASSIEQVVAMQQFCLDYNEQFYRSSTRTWSFVGRTKFKGGFDETYRRLNVHPHAMENDESKFDASCCQELLEADKRRRWRSLAPEWRTEANAKRFDNLHMNVTYSMCVLADGTIAVKHTGNPSGDANTIVRNTQILFHALAYAFIRGAKKKGYAVVYGDFMQNVEFVLTGDDNTGTVSELAWEFFNPDTIRAAFAELGIKVKSEDVKGLLDCSFLQCKFVKREDFVYPVPEYDKVISSLVGGDIREDELVMLDRTLSLLLEAWPNERARELLRKVALRLIASPELPESSGELRRKDVVARLWSDEQYKRQYTGQESGGLKLMPDKTFLAQALVRFSCQHDSLPKTSELFRDTVRAVLTLPKATVENPEKAARIISAAQQVTSGVAKAAARVAYRYITEAPTQKERERRLKDKVRTEMGKFKGIAKKLAKTKAKPAAKKQVRREVKKEVKREERKEHKPTKSWFGKARPVAAMAQTLKSTVPVNTVTTLTTGVYRQEFRHRTSFKERGSDLIYSPGVGATIPAGSYTAGQIIYTVQLALPNLPFKRANTLRTMYEYYKGSFVPLLLNIGGTNNGSAFLVCYTPDNDENPAAMADSERVLRVTNYNGQAWCTQVNMSTVEQLLRSVPIRSNVAAKAGMLQGRPGGEPASVNEDFGGWFSIISMVDQTLASNIMVTGLWEFQFKNAQINGNDLGLGSATSSISGLTSSGAAPVPYTVASSTQFWLSSRYKTQDGLEFGPAVTNGNLMRVGTELLNFLRSGHVLAVHGWAQGNAGGSLSSSTGAIKLYCYDIDQSEISSDDITQAFHVESKSGAVVLCTWSANVVFADFPDGAAYFSISVEPTTAFTLNSGVGAWSATMANLPYKAGAVPAVRRPRIEITCDEKQDAEVCIEQVGEHKLMARVPRTATQIDGDQNLLYRTAAKEAWVVLPDGRRQNVDLKEVRALPDIEDLPQPQLQQNAAAAANAAAPDQRDQRARSADAPSLATRGGLRSFFTSG